MLLLGLSDLIDYSPLYNRAPHESYSFAMSFSSVLMVPLGPPTHTSSCHFASASSLSLPTAFRPTTLWNSFQTVLLCGHRTKNKKCSASSRGGPHVFKICSRMYQGPFLQINATSKSGPRNSVMQERLMSVKSGCPTTIFGRKCDKYCFIQHSGLRASSCVFCVCFGTAPRIAV